MLLCELARGSMGELIGVVGTREGTLAGNARLLERVYLSISVNFTYLFGFDPDNHIYVQANAVRYNKCNFGQNREAESLFKSMSGEKNA